MDRDRRQRSFMTELLVWMVLLIVVPLAAISAYFYNHEAAGWRQIEREKSLQLNQTAQKSLIRLGDSILGVTITNGYWEANRQAVLHSDRTWLEENISDMPGVVPNVDFVAETDLTGKVLVQAGNVEEFQGSVRYPYILQKFEKTRQFTGLMNTSKGIAVIAVSPVTGDTGEGEPVGLLITGHLLTNEDIAGLSDMLQTDLGILTATQQFLTSSGEIKVEELKKYRPIAAAETMEQFELERHNKTYFASTTVALQDMAGQPIGILHSEMPARSTQEAADSLRTIGLYSIGVMLLMMAVVVTLLRHRIILPLRHFTATLQEVAAGRPVTEIPKHVQHAEAQIVGAIRQIMQWNEVLEQTVELRTAEIRNLLDNAKQGFMSVGADRKALYEYSIECARIFGREVGGVPLPELFYPEDEQERALLDSILHECFQEQDELKREMIFSLLPEELQVNGLTVRAEYKWLPQDKDGQGAVPAGEIMVMLTDITDKRKLESLMQRERKTLKMVVYAVTHPEEYAQAMISFDAFVHYDLPQLSASGEAAEQMLLRLSKTVHTLKGSFAMMQFIHIVPKLHELETWLLGLLESRAEPDALWLERQIRELGIDRWLEADTDILQQVLGDTYADLGKEYDVKLDKQQWDTLIRHLEARLTAPEDIRWLEEVRQWRHKPVKTLLQQYPQYLMELAGQSGLLLNPVELEGGDIPVDPDRLQGLAQSLVHIVRNIVTHGIEPPEERVKQGKDKYANVRFTIERKGEGLVITIRDDGRGINLEAVRRKAEERGIGFVSGSAATADEADIADLVFAETVTTASKVTDLAGRGIGLSAVKAEAEKLGGTVKVKTRAGKGTAFILHIPLLNS
ncbi:ATP-binding protein [Paenibacillus hamazuiensis]|uniref:ATP-binding protein n=1 Tax=Paenibacillus hamazuiensis TaxID=2936508 RepID=UPI00200CEA17|nr:ATP-binding protein [Paenibacillus hamazuiensis]